MKLLKINILAVITLCIIQSVNAQDRQFVRTYQSAVLTKGTMDIEAWSTYRTGRKYFFNQLDNLLDLLVRKFQAA